MNGNLGNLVVLERREEDLGKGEYLSQEMATDHFENATTMVRDSYQGDVSSAN